jgi:hypothetical protein
MKDKFLDLVPNRQPRRESCWVRYYPNRCPLFPVQGRRHVLAAVISVGEDKLPRRRTSQANRVSDPLERGTWSLRGACGLDRIRPNRVYDVSVVQPAGISTISISKCWADLRMKIEINLTSPISGETNCRRTRGESTKKVSLAHPEQSLDGRRAR